MKNNFQSFLKTSKYKTIGCFNKTISCFSLSLKNTFLLKDWECLCFGFNLEWITKLKLPQILTKTAQQQQAQPSLQHPSKGLDSSKLEHHLVQQIVHRAFPYLLQISAQFLIGSAQFFVVRTWCGNFSPRCCHLCLEDMHSLQDLLCGRIVPSRGHNTCGYDRSLPRTSHLVGRNSYTIVSWTLF